MLHPCAQSRKGYRYLRTVLASRRDFLLRGVALAGLLLLLGRLAAFWNITSALVRWPWQFDFDEGHNLNATLLLAHGTNIYRPNGPEGFVSAPYPPLFYVANAPLTWLFGPAFGPGRLLSALAAVAIAALLLDVAYTLTRRWWPGLWAGAVWLSFSPVIVWAGLYKQDMPALALQVAGLAWVVRYWGPHPGPRAGDSPPTPRYAAVVFFALAFFTKQSAVTVAAAVALWLVVRDWRSGLRFVVVLGAALALPFGALDRLLDGGLSLHVIGYQWKPWNLGYTGHLLERLGDEYWPLLLAALGVVAGAVGITIRNGRGQGQRGVWRAILEGGRSPWGLLVLYTLAGGVWTFIATGIKGGNYNLLLDGLPPLALLGPLGVDWLLHAGGPRKPPGATPNGRGRGPAWRALAALLLGGLFAVQVTRYADPHTWYHGGWPSAQQDQSMRGLSNLVAHTAGDIYSEDDYLILRNGRQVIYDDPSTFPLLAQAGRWDDAGFQQALRDRRFGLVLLWPGSGRLTAAESQVLAANYTRAFADVLDSYVPKLIPDAPQYALSCRLVLGADAVELQGYSLGPGVAERGVPAGGVLQVAVDWSALTALHGSYASFVHLVDASGKRRAGRDEPATGTGQPTTAWAVAQPIVDNLGVPLPADLPPGRYRLVVGMYANEGSTLTPLMPACADATLPYGGAIGVGQVDITPPGQRGQ